ncbi:hypothetical protein AB0420_14155 [Streptomyces caelestis]|uniref:Uncharacterized protein n=1 Tax=Streptomyces heliomycini TaxID=284032 RepID=A0ABV5L802_9ACTN|nr:MULTISPECIES: hypothetical protein [Streptomyces]
MSTYNFNGPVSGQNNFGDHNQNLLIGNLDELVARVREEQPGRAPEAELIRAEVTRAAAEDRPVDRGRIQDWLATLREGADAGSGVLALITSLRALLGL